MKLAAIAFTLGIIAALTVFGMAIAFLKVLNRRKPMVNPLLSSSLDRDRSFADHIDQLQQALQRDEEMAIAIIKALDSGNDSAIAEAKKLAEGIVSNSQNARG